MDEVFKKAVVDSVGIDPKNILDKITDLAQYGQDIIEADTDKITNDTDKVTQAQAGVTLLLEKAEELGMSEADFLVFLIAGAMGKVDK